jgi:hypothetical protein
MNAPPDNPDEAEVIKGDFFTDGKTFILRLADTPLSGTGATAQEAFENLMSTQQSAGALTGRIKALARDQQGETLRTAIIRMTLAGLIVFGVIGGALVTAASMAPKVAADIATSTAVGLINWLDGLTPAREEKLTILLKRVRTLLGEPEACQPSTSPDAAPPK